MSMNHASDSPTLVVASAATYASEPTIGDIVEPPASDVLWDDDEEESIPEPSKTWVVTAVVISVAIACIVAISILISIGHLGPLTGPVTDEHKAKSTDPNSAGVGMHEKVASSIKTVLQTPFSSGLSNTVSNGMFSPSDIARDLPDAAYEDAPRLAAFVGLRYRHDEAKKEL